MALEIKWSKRADKKFDEILEFLLTNWGEQVTKNFVKKVYDFLDILVEYPDIGSLEYKSKSIRGFTIIKQINIFYRVTDKNIVLLNFFYNRQNPKKKKFNE